MIFRLLSVFGAPTVEAEVLGGIFNEFLNIYSNEKFRCHEWRLGCLEGGESPEDLIEEKVEEWKRLNLIPEFVVVFLPVNDGQSWVEPLHGALRREGVRSVWVWTDMDPHGQKALWGFLDQPEEESYLLNLNYPQTFPVRSRGKLPKYPIERLDLYARGERSLLFYLVRFIVELIDYKS